ncbi:MAG: Na+/H+ antiporter [Azospirillum brasilense]|nr:MAG: Na+/H+ antiporter [Azospirillum brasilense]
MEAITASLILLVAIIVSGQVARLLPLPIPVPLVQICLGAFLAAVFHIEVELNPEIFFLLFLPPLLFLDGWRIPKDGLFKDKGTILELALGLVVFTVLGVGLFIHWLIPSMPMAVAFALAAILSPTDPIAVSAIAAKVPIPKRVMHVLEGESLLNDASGLVCMRFAVAAALTGAFSISEAFVTFLWLAIGGIGIGALLTWGIMKGKDAITRRLGEETGSQILLSLLIPFGAYLLAEHLHCSGILAAVAAGVTMSYAEQSGQLMAVTRVRRSAVWDTVQFTANGIIFVLLGEQLPRIIAGAKQVVRETGHHDPIWLLIYIVAINLVLAAMRFFWVWVSLRFTMFRATRRGHAAIKPSWRLIAAMSLAGVRGAITLAGILTLPLTLNDGSAFPARDLAILLAAGVIILSLVAASIGLPMVLKGLRLPPEPRHTKNEDDVRRTAAKRAIRAVEQVQHEKGGTQGPDMHLYADAAARIMELYRLRIDGQNKTMEEAEESRRMERIERELRLAALRAEREEIYSAGRARKLADDVVRKMVKDIDLLEARLLSS